MSGRQTGKSDENGVNKAELYLQKLENKIEEMFTSWAKDKGYESVDDVLKGENIGNRRIYETVSWKKIAGMCEGVNLNVLNILRAGDQLDTRIKSARYLDNSGKIEIDVIEYLKNNVFDEEETENNADN